MFYRIDRMLSPRSVLPYLLLIVLSLGFVNADAQMRSAPVPPAAGEAALSDIEIAPVVVDGVTLFYVRGVLAYPAGRRAEDIASRIRAVAADRTISTQSLRLEEGPIGTQVLAGTQFIMNVLDADARLGGIERHVLAHTCVSRIREAIETYRHDREPDVLIRHGLYALFATLMFLLILWGGRRLSLRLNDTFDKRYKEMVHGLHIQSWYFAHALKLWHTLTGVLKFLEVVIALAIAWFYVHHLLSLFPWTRGMAKSLRGVVMDPFRTIADGFVGMIPDIVFLAILGLVTWYLLKLIHLIFVSIEKGTITLSGFDAEWARPTYRLVRAIVIGFALVVAYPYIPGSHSAAFKGVSLFIGVIFSLGSTAMIGNILAGYSMVYRRTFKVGDLVKVGNHIGSVEKTGVMVTTLRTPKNEVVVVPNSMIVNGEVVNYSMLAKTQGLILHTTVGIGYETPWRQVEAMLLEAAARTPGLLQEPGPFVLQKELADFAVTYEINVHSDQPLEMFNLYSALHQNILDVFNEYGVQIMTPAYMADPAQAKVVPKEQWYLTPARPPKGGEASSPKDEAA